MSRKITTLISFKIESTFEEWVKIFDSKEANLRHSEFNIKPIFRGFSKDDPKKVICIHHSIERNINSLYKQIVNRLKFIKLIFPIIKELSLI